ncbi:MAG TPA: NAD(P)H-hydrate dehydratase [Syntrophorhabdaceae bacterium]|nr:NAD(P)H-hydrate dehydratase [Syntrophorhabdaceae bacterium]
MKLLSPARMAACDAYAINTWGIPSAVLMENAGRNTYRLVKERYLENKLSRISVICGKGNNGGDGFVFARYALADGYRVKVYGPANTETLKGDAALNMKLYSSVGGEIVSYESSPKLMRDALKNTDVIIDALFGTGLSKEVQGIEKLLIEAINRSEKSVIAIDMPSGIDGEKGVPLGVAVKATHTFTYGYPKTGQIVYPGADYVGKLTVVDISIPAMAEGVIGIDGHVIDGEMIRGFLKTRLASSHKGTYGHIAVIAGSKGKTGAAHMASLAALRIGAGLVTLAIPESLNEIMEVKLTEVMTNPVQDGGKGFFPLACLDELKEFVRDKDLLVIGPGLSQSDDTMKLVRELVMTAGKPIVMDADGINAFKGHSELFKEIPSDVMLTPHPGELARILGVTPKDINNDRIAIGRGFVERHKVNLLLKGARSILFATDGQVFFNLTGNPALAKGGSGDILTGFIGGLIGQGYTMQEAAILAVYIHGYIADTYREESGSEVDLLASDLLTGIGKTLDVLRRGEERIYIEKSL